jgi:VanZ family protein
VISLWLPVAAWMAAIYWGAGISQVPGPVAAYSDTVLHMAGYSGLALLTLRATSGGRWSGVTWRSVLLALAIATIHGLTVEWEQMYIPTRMAEWRDVRNDILGASIGLAPAWAWATMKGPTRGLSHDL